MLVGGIGRGHHCALRQEPSGALICQMLLICESRGPDEETPKALADFNPRLEGEWASLKRSLSRFVLLVVHLRVITQLGNLPLARFRVTNRTGN